MFSPARPLPLTDISDERQIAFAPRQVVLAGYTGRDRAQVQRHIDELLAQGIPAPERVPDLYHGLPWRLQVEGRLPPGSGWSSGEVEYVLLVTASGVYVGIGSDHTDRELEQTAVVAAKQAFSKIIGPRVIPLGRLASGWDVLVLRSWIEQDGDRYVYQESPLAAIISPNDLLGLIPRRERTEGLVVYSGTIAAQRAAPMSGPCRFEAELLANGEQPLLTCTYQYEAGPAH